MTYNNIIDLFREFASQHTQIKSFGYGQISSINQIENIEYPLLFVSPKDSSLNFNNLDLSLNILLMDKLKDGLENEQEIHSDTLSVISDLKVWLGNSASDYFNVEDQSPVYPFTERFGDNLGGWTFSCKLSVEWDWNLCTIPGISDQFFDGNGQIINTNYTDLLQYYMPLTGGTFTGCIAGPCADFDSFFSGGTPLSLIINNIASQYSGGSSSGYIFSAGTNLYLTQTGSTVEYGLNSDIYTNNIYNYGDINNIGALNTTGLLTASELLCLNAMSAATFQQIDVLDNVFSGHTYFYDDVDVLFILNASDVSVSNQLDAVNLKATGNVNFTSNATINSLSATTINSGSTNLYNIFANINHTHSISDVINLQNNLDTKANLSGATFTDLIFAPTANTTYLKVNTLSANTTNPERAIIYDGVVNGFSNVLVGIASASTYAQLNIQNLSPASGSSSDIIATANNGSESTNYVDLGINSSGFNSGNVGAANDGYVYGAANDFYVGNTTRDKKVGIFVGATSATTVDFTSGKTTFNQPVSAVTITASTYYSGTSLLQSYFPYDQSSFRLRGSSSDRWHTFTKFGFSFSSAALTNGRLYAFPLIVGENITIDRLGVSLSSTPTSAGTEVIRLGIYNSLPSTHYPGTLLLDAGTVPASAITNLVSVAINQSLTPGLYYLALQSNNTNTIRTIPTTAIDGTIGFGNNPVLGITSYMYSTNHTSFGVLPNNPFTATTNATTTAPAIFYRIN